VATGQAEHAKSNPSDTCSDNAKTAGRSLGDVKEAARYQGASIIDPDDHGSMILEVGYDDPGAEGKGWMGGGKSIHIKRFSACRPKALKLLAIPTRKSGLRECQSGSVETGGRAGFATA
jgi:hypothetical protein